MKVYALQKRWLGQLALKKLDMMNNIALFLSQRGSYRFKEQVLKHPFRLYVPLQLQTQFQKSTDTMLKWM